MTPKNPVGDFYPHVTRWVTPFPSLQKLSGFPLHGKVQIVLVLFFQAFHHRAYLAFLSPYLCVSSCSNHKGPVTFSQDTVYMFLQVSVHAVLQVRLNIQPPAIEIYPFLVYFFFCFFVYKAVHFSLPIHDSLLSLFLHWTKFSEKEARLTHLSTSTKFHLNIDNLHKCPVSTLTLCQHWYQAQYLLYLILTATHRGMCYGSETKYSPTSWDSRLRYAPSSTKGNGEQSLQTCLHLSCVEVLLMRR